MIYDGVFYKIFDEKTKLSMGGSSNRNKAGKVFKLKLGKEENFFGWSSFCLDGASLQRGRCQRLYRHKIISKIINA